MSAPAWIPPPSVGDASDGKAVASGAFWLTLAAGLGTGLGYLLWKKEGAITLGIVAPVALLVYLTSQGAKS